MGCGTDVVSVRMWVPSLAWLSGLRIQHWRKLQCSSQMWLSVAMAVAPSTAAAPIQPLDQELSCVTGAAKKGKKKKIIMFIFQPGSATLLLCVLEQVTYPLQLGISILSSD